MTYACRIPSQLQLLLEQTIASVFEGAMDAGPPRGSDDSAILGIVSAIKDTVATVLAPQLQTYNACSARLRLPDEIWCMAWKYLPLRDRFDLCLVCHAWRQLVLSSPAVWAAIDICSFETSNGPDQRDEIHYTDLRTVRRALILSKSVPLTLELERCDQWQHPSEDYLTALTGCLRNDSGRIVAVYYNSTSVDVVQALLSQSTGLPALRVLRGEPWAGIDLDVVLPAVELRTLEHIDLANDSWKKYRVTLAPGGWASIGNSSFPELKTLAARIDTQSQVLAVLRAAPLLRALTLRQLNFTRIEMGDLCDLLCDRLAALAELHLSGLTPELEEWFCSQVDHAKIPLLSVAYAPADDYYAEDEMCQRVASELVGPLDLRCQRADGRTAFLFRELAEHSGRRTRLLNVPDRALPALYDLLDPASCAVCASITSLTLNAADWGPETHIDLTLAAFTEVSHLTIIVRARREFAPLIGLDPRIRNMPDLMHFTIRCPVGGLRVPEELVCAVVCGLQALPLSSLTLEGITLAPDERENDSDGESEGEPETLADYAETVHVDAPVACEWTGLEEFVARADRAARGVLARLW